MPGHKPVRDTARSTERNSGAGPALTQDTGRSGTPDQPDDEFHYEYAMMDWTKSARFAGHPVMGSLSIRQYKKEHGAGAMHSYQPGDLYLHNGRFILLLPGAGTQVPRMTRHPFQLMIRFTISRPATQTPQAPPRLGRTGKRFSRR